MNIINLEKKVISVIAFFIGKGLQATVRVDAGVREEIKDWPEGYTIIIETYRHGPRICYIKKDGYLLVKKNEKYTTPDVCITFKSIHTVFECFTGRIGLDQAYAENRLVIKGDLFQTLKIVRMFYACECYLFPKCIWSKIIRVKPRLESSTLNVYVATLLGKRMA